MLVQKFIHLNSEKIIIIIFFLNLRRKIRRNTPKLDYVLMKLCVVIMLRLKLSYCWNFIKKKPKMSVLVHYINSNWIFIPFKNIRIFECVVGDQDIVQFCWNSFFLRILWHRFRKKIIMMIFSKFKWINFWTSMVLKNGFS